MKIRVILGNKLAQEYVSRDGLKDLYSAPGILVQGDLSVVSMAGYGPGKAFIAGQVIGKRSGPALSRTRVKDPDFAEFVCSQPIDICMKEIEGRFMLVKVSPEEKCQICCDRYSRADLYYQKTADGVVFASGLDLLTLKKSSLEYNPAAIAHSIYIYGFRPAKKHTIYKGIKRLGVGEIACWDGSLSLKELAPAVSAVKEHYGEDELNKYADIFLDAVKKRSSPDGNLVYLSSGWDSSAILACLVKLHGSSKVRALIGRMRFSERSGVINQLEIDRAGKIADYFGVKLEIAEYDYYRRGAELIEKLQALMSSQMLANMSFFHWAILAEYVAGKARGEAVFAGEISDGAHNLGFSQFVTVFHPVLDFREYGDKMASYLFGPTFLKSVQDSTFSADMVYNFMKQKFNTGIFDEAEQGLSARARQLLSSFFLRDNRLPFWSLKNSSLMTEKGRQLYSREMEETYLSKPAGRVTPETLYSWYIHLYNSFHWQAGTVASLALTAQEKGFEINLPFWDSRLHEFLSAMPESWGRGLDLKPTKYPLKWTLENRIDYPKHLQIGPHSYTYDVIPDFSPVGEFIHASAFTSCIKELFKRGRHEALLSPDFFNMDYIRKIVGSYLEGKEAVGRQRTDLAGLAFTSLFGAPA